MIAAGIDLPAHKADSLTLGGIRIGLPRACPGGCTSKRISGLASTGPR